MRSGFLWDVASNHIKALELSYKDQSESTSEGDAVKSINARYKFKR